jgi:hypothetical protein
LDIATAVAKKASQIARQDRSAMPDYVEASPAAAR